MKKRVILAFALAMTLALCACSNKEGASTPDNNVVTTPDSQTVQEEVPTVTETEVPTVTEIEVPTVTETEPPTVTEIEVPTVTETEPPTVTEIEPPVIEETTTPTETESSEDLQPNEQIEVIVGNQNPNSPFYNMERWVDTHGVFVSAPAGVTSLSQEHDANGNIIGDVEVYSDVQMFEDGSPKEGYKMVNIIVVTDFSNMVSLSNYTEHTINLIDAYTGYTFESGVPNADGSITIEFNGISYDISVDYSQTQDGAITITRFCILCPEWYDGVICSVGYASIEKWSQWNALDLSSRFYSLDETPFYGDGYYYFGIQ